MQGMVLSCLCIISHHTAAQQQAAEHFELHQSLIRIAPTFSTKAKVPSIRLMMSVKLMTITCTTAEQQLLELLCCKLSTKPCRCKCILEYGQLHARAHVRLLVTSTVCAPRATTLLGMCS